MWTALQQRATICWEIERLHSMFRLTSFGHHGLHDDIRVSLHLQHALCTWLATILSWEDKKLPVPPDMLKVLQGMLDSSTDERRSYALPLTFSLPWQQGN